MTVMRETGLIVVSTMNGSLFQSTLQEGRLIQKQIKPTCEHDVYLLCVQVAGQEYLAVSCWRCEDIKLMNINKQKGSSGLEIEYEVIRAFRGRNVRHMCQGEENRIFVLSDGSVLELDTATTPFTNMRSINTGMAFSLCYVPDPHRLLVVCDWKDVCGISCDDGKAVWKAEKGKNFDPSCLFFLPSHDVLFVVDRENIRIRIVSPATGHQIKYMNLPDHVKGITGLHWFKEQILVHSRVSYPGKSRFSLFCLKKN